MSYTAGLVGAGRIGRIHADIYANTDGIELVAIAEPNSAVRSERGEAWNVDDRRRYADHTAMVSSEDLDIVSVATPTSYHCDVVLDVAGSPADPDVILCEKPLAEGPADALDAVDACKVSGTELVVDHTLRFSSTFTALREFIDDGAVGTIRSVQLHASGSLFRLGTHYVDLLCFLLDDRVAEIRGGYCSSYTRDPSDAEVDDRWGACTLLFTNGTVAQIDLTRSGSVANQLTIVGDRGMIVIQGSDATSIFNRKLTAEYWKLSDGEHVPAELAESLAELWSSDMSENTSGTTGDRGMYAAQRQFDALGTHLFELLEGRADNRSPGAEAAHVVEVLAATIISHEIGGAVSLPLSDSIQSMRVSSR